MDGKRLITRSIRKERLEDSGIHTDRAFSSPKSTMHDFGLSQSKLTRNSVRFAQEDELEQVIAPKDESVEVNVSEFWYTKDEYLLSQKARAFIVKMMERGMGSLEHDDELCPRGLEARTKLGSRRRRESIEASWDAVLGEQEKQWQEGRYNASALARVYFESSAQSAMVAYIAAKGDAEFVHGKEDAEPRKPKRSQSEKKPIRVMQRRSSTSST